MIPVLLGGWLARRIDIKRQLEQSRTIRYCSTGRDPHGRSSSSELILATLRREGVCLGWRIFTELGYEEECAVWCGIGPSYV